MELRTKDKLDYKKVLHGKRSYYSTYSYNAYIEALPVERF